MDLAPPDAGVDFGMVACSSTKKGEDDPEATFPAEELYDSWFFDDRVSAVKAHCDDWAIFSAKHGFVEPDDELAYYDKEIGELPAEERRELAREVAERTPDVGCVMILMGRKYADPLMDALPDGVEVWDPLEGVRLFDQSEKLEMLQNNVN